MRTIRNIYFPFTALTSFCFITLIAGNEDDISMRREHYLLRTRNTDLVLHRAAVIALMKAKAQRILSTLPSDEAVVYRQCSRDASNVPELAQCTVALLNVREASRLNRLNNNSGGRSLLNAPSEETGWLGWMWRRVQELVYKPAQPKTVPSRHPIPSTNFFTPLTQLQPLPEIAPFSRENSSETASYLNRRIKSMKVVKFPPASPAGKLRILEKLRAVRTAQRVKRDGAAKVGKEFGLYRSLDKLQQVVEFREKADYCTDYIRRVSQGNYRLLGSATGSRVKGHFFIDDAQKTSQLFDEAERRLGDYLSGKLSLLSPRLFPIYPTTGRNRTTINPLLSPTLFSFHNEGPLSLPSLLDVALNGHASESLRWLDLLLELSGASRTLDALLGRIHKSGDYATVEKLYSAMRRMEEFNDRFKRVKELFSSEQADELDLAGYTIMNDGQERELYGEGLRFESDVSRASRQELEYNLEEDIRRLAKLGSDGNANDARSGGRTKRQVPNNSEMKLLAPFILPHQMGDGAILRRIVLSPTAFATTLMSPEFLASHVLSPTAFTPMILSPGAMVAYVLNPTTFFAKILTPGALRAKVLSPTSFVASVLSPRALSAFVLSPKALLATVLSPRFNEISVLSPTLMEVTVLSPTVLSLGIASPKILEVYVLSPNILSTGLLGKDMLTVHILSPDILSGTSIEKPTLVTRRVRHRITQNSLINS